MREPDHEDESAVPEDVAHRILARAAEIEAREGPSVPLSRLRDVAREAGIAPSAMDRAVHEILNPPRSRAARLWDRVVTWFSHTSPVNAVTAVTLNVVAFSAAYILMGLAARLAAMIGGGWMVSNGMLIVATLIGVGMAVRVRARLTAILLAITAAAMLAEYPLQLIYGIGVVQGAATKWALLLSAGFGIMLSRLLTRRTGNSSRPVLPTELSATAAPDQVEKSTPPDLNTLRLRPVAG